MSRIMNTLTTKVDKDCDNLNSAAEAINKMDRHISGTIKKNKPVVGPIVSIAAGYAYSVYGDQLKNLANSLE